MRKRVLAVAVLLLCLAVLALVVVWKYPAPAGPTKLAVPAVPGASLENYRLLQEGMTLHQVEAILGRAEEDDCSTSTDPLCCRAYRRDAFQIVLHYRDDELVWGYYVTRHDHIPVRPAPPRRPTFLEWLRSWLPFSKPETPAE
jgi:hypothetical protein